MQIRWYLSCTTLQGILSGQAQAPHCCCPAVINSSSTTFRERTKSNVSAIFGLTLKSMDDEETVSNSALCARCQGILRLDNIRWTDDHPAHSTYRIRMQWHPSISSLRDTANEGCELCLNVWQEIVVKGTIEHKKEAWPTFRGINAEITVVHDPYGSNVSKRPPNWSLGFLLLAADGDATMVRFHQFEQPPRLSCNAQQTSNASLGAHASPDQRQPTTRDLTLAKGWIDQCLTNHFRCQSSLKRRTGYPSRLIKVWKADQTVTAQLVECVGLSQTPEYATLSHCWGSGPIQTLRNCCLKEYKNTIPVGTLSKTFRDAFDVVVDLQIPYIWIDSLCIIQDSEEDWNLEYQRMADVYENAALNIAAAAFSSADSGLFVPKRAQHVEPLKVVVDMRSGTRSLSGTYSLFHKEAWSIRVDEAPLNRRGWVLQERFFSPRILHFGVDQLLWECEESRGSEIRPQLTERSNRLDHKTTYSYRQLEDTAAQICGAAASDCLHTLDGPECRWCEDRSSLEILYTSWIGIVEAYSRASLTYRDDKLIAIAGITSRFERLSGSRFVYGLWYDQIAQGLLWYCLPKDQNNITRRPELKTHIPSWSWACFDQPITFQNKGIGRPGERSARVIGYEHSPASIHVRALLIKASFREDQVRCVYDTHVRPVGFYKSRSVSLHLDAPDSDIPTLTGVPLDRDNDEPNRRFAYLLCLEIENATAGLVLKRGSHRGHYSRIGMFVTKYDLRPMHSALPDDDFLEESACGNEEPGFHTITLL